MKITLLGTGSPVPMANRASSGYLLEIGDEILVFDHGAGAHANFLRTGYKATDLNTIFFSHLHTDHCLDYARLVHSRWDQGAGKIPDLKVYAPAYMQQMTDLLFSENGVFQPDLDGRINSPGSQRVYLNRGGVLPRSRPAPNITALYDTMEIENSNWKITVREVMHQPGYIEPYAFRIETDEGVLVYSGDTGPCDAIIELAHGADMLINMCYFVTGTFKPEGKTVTSSGHKEAAFIANEAGVKTLVATHFTPQMDAPGVKEQCLAEMAQMYSGRIIWGEDMMKLPLNPIEIPHAG